jgi:hypothetical protein
MTHITITDFLKNSFLKDEYNFFDMGTRTCIIILSIIFITDCITTIAILELGGFEKNPVMAHFIEAPILMLFIKIISTIAIILITKIMYDISHNIVGYYYSKFCIYLVFAIAAGLTLSVIVNNLSILSQLTSH